MDGLTGFPDAVRAVFPERRIQRCMVRNSVKFVSYKDLKAVCAELKAIYRAPGEEAGPGAIRRKAAIQTPADLQIMGYQPVGAL
jgi:transposase-like protein